ncbi:MAG: PGF-pre-PGF domain-containing protein [Methanosarcinales archaeon]|nr:MAG: PGF-pre-PGF domain-containing protein [Methanosarcinales archaeon]
MVGQMSPRVTSRSRYQVRISRIRTSEIRGFKPHFLKHPLLLAAAAAEEMSTLKRNIPISSCMSIARKYIYKSTSSIAFTFHTLGIVTEAGFIPKTTEGCITALGEILKGRPSFATIDVPYKDATYFNVWAGPTGYSESSKVENQYLVFKKSDVKDDEIVRLMMYRDGAWIDARTEKLSEGTYKAYTQGFGGFAIVKTIAPAMTTTQPAATPVAPGENKGMEPVNLALIIGVFLVIMIGVIYYLKIR